MKIQASPLLLCSLFVISSSEEPKTASSIKASLSLDSSLDRLRDLVTIQVCQYGEPSYGQEESFRIPRTMFKKVLARLQDGNEHVEENSLPHDQRIAHDADSWSEFLVTRYYNRTSILDAFFIYLSQVTGRGEYERYLMDYALISNNLTFTVSVQDLKVAIKITPIVKISELKFAFDIFSNYGKDYRFCWLGEKKYLFKQFSSSLSRLSEYGWARKLPNGQNFTTPVALVIDRARTPQGYLIDLCNDGETLADFLGANPNIEAKTLYSLLKDVACSIASVHECNFFLSSFTFGSFLVRRVKENTPSAVLFKFEEKTPRAVLFKFEGIAAKTDFPRDMTHLNWRDFGLLMNSLIKVGTFSEKLAALSNYLMCTGGGIVHGQNIAAKYICMAETSWGIQEFSFGSLEKGLLLDAYTEKHTMLKSSEMIVTTYIHTAWIPVDKDSEVTIHIKSKMKSKTILNKVLEVKQDQFFVIPSDSKLSIVGTFTFNQETNYKKGTVLRISGAYLHSGAIKIPQSSGDQEACLEPCQGLEALSASKPSPSLTKAFREYTAAEVVSLLGEVYPKE